MINTRYNNYEEMEDIKKLIKALEQRRQKERNIEEEHSQKEGEVQLRETEEHRREKQNEGEDQVRNDYQETFMTFFQQQSFFQQSN